MQSTVFFHFEKLPNNVYRNNAKESDHGKPAAVKSDEISFYVFSCSDSEQLKGR